MQCKYSSGDYRGAARGLRSILVNPERSRVTGREDNFSSSQQKDTGILITGPVPIIPELWFELRPPSPPAYKIARGVDWFRALEATKFLEYVSRRMGAIWVDKKVNLSSCKTPCGGDERALPVQHCRDQGGKIVWAWCWPTFAFPRGQRQSMYYNTKSDLG